MVLKVGDVVYPVLEFRGENRFSQKLREVCRLFPPNISRERDAAIHVQHPGWAAANIDSFDPIVSSRSRASGGSWGELLPSSSTSSPS